MAAARKARCFIAMAFDHDDTDQLYEKSILPVLKSNNITPVVINQREDNRDVNQQIIEQLESCDFCIADLTYTRPSVYFEAGYAQRAVDVIYTVRGDHLHKNQPEDRRVHFDLQMKPLIRWNAPDDANFRTKLEKRLRATVLREWNKKQAAQDDLRLGRTIFSNMSLNDRLLWLCRNGLRDLSKLGYRKWYYVKPFPKLGEFLLDEVNPKQITDDRWFVSIFPRGPVLHVVTLRAMASMTLTTLRNEFGAIFLSQLGRDQYFWDVKPRLRQTVTHVVEHHILCSTAEITQSRITAALPSLSWDSSLQCYVIKPEEVPLHYDGFSENLGYLNIFVHFIKGIQSLPEFGEELKEITQRIDANQQS